jgi:disease resistance protein RPM1
VEEPVEKDSLQGLNNWDLSVLMRRLLQYLDNKRYLVILDDIWTISAWEHLMVVLPDHNNASKIIVTTRIESVANRCSQNSDYVYKMKPLDEAASKHLFFKRIFGTYEECPIELQDISNGILKKCGGMPLAITSIAGLLASKTSHSKHQWQTVCHSLGTELEINPTLDGMRHILSLSYQNLPHYIKTCFLYLSIYPEDFEIRRKSLVRRWIAEGFITRKRGLSVEEVAERYFYELVNRSLLLPIEISYSGEIKAIKIHDMYLELILTKSLEENFVLVVGGDHYTTLLHDKIHRLSVHDIGFKQLTPRINLCHVRSLSTFGLAKEWVSSPQLELVRVLDLEGNRTLKYSHLRYICKFFLLKYLSLRKTYISQLPSDIMKLQNLETLDIRDTKVVQVPSSIVKLHKLTHLMGGRKVDCTGWIMSSSIKLPQGVQNMKNIQTLTRINISEGCSVHGLRQLKQIKKLGIHHTSKYENNDDIMLVSFCSALEQVQMSLRSLTFHCTGPNNRSLECLHSLKCPPVFLQSLEFLGCIGKLPRWVSSLNNLTEFVFSGVVYQSKGAFRVLQKLPKLLYLKQHEPGKNVEEELVAVNKGFPHLRELVLGGYKTVYSLKFNEGAAPRLQKLVLEFMIFGSLSGVEYIKNLEEITLQSSERGSDFDTIVSNVTAISATHPKNFKVIVGQ